MSWFTDWRASKDMEQEDNFNDGIPVTQTKPRGMKPTYKARVQLLQDLHAFKNYNNQLDYMIARITEINQKDYWTVADVDFLNQSKAKAGLIRSVK